MLENAYFTRQTAAAVFFMSTTVCFVFVPQGMAAISFNYMRILTKRKENMIKQFEISASVQKQLGDYLAANQTDLKTAMADETRNGEVAAIIHAGLPMMVRKIYSLEKMKNFFWTKKELMVEFVAMRLAAAEKKNAKKKR